MGRRRVIPALVCSSIGGVLIAATAVLFHGTRHMPLNIPLPTTPWQSIGGCGLGGSGVGATGGIRWTGNGVKGYLLSGELTPFFAAGGSEGNAYTSMLAAPRIVLHPSWSTRIGITVPCGYKTAQVRFQENLPESWHHNGGLGDITADVSRDIGGTGASTLHAALTFPTGMYDAVTGTGSTVKIYPASLQMGRGVWSVSLGGGHTFDFENKALFIDGTFSWPFIIRADRRNEYLDSDYRAYGDATVNRERFYYRHWIKPYGESDRGDYYPPSLQLHTALSWYRNRSLVHSLQCSFDAPFGTRWIHHYNPTRYDPRPDPDHRAWDLLLAYGIELSRTRFPLFAAIGLPLHDRKGIDNRWDGIDTESLFREWVVTAGLTAGIF